MVLKCDNKVKLCVVIINVFVCVLIKFIIFKLFCLFNVVVGLFKIYVDVVFFNNIFVIVKCWIFLLDNVWLFKLIWCFSVKCFKFNCLNIVCIVLFFLLVNKFWCIVLLNNCWDCSKIFSDLNLFLLFILNIFIFLKWIELLFNWYNFVIICSNVFFFELEGFIIVIFLFLLILKLIFDNIYVCWF